MMDMQHQPIDVVEQVAQIQALLQQVLDAQTRIQQAQTDILRQMHTQGAVITDLKAEVDELRSVIGGPV